MNPNPDVRAARRIRAFAADIAANPAARSLIILARLRKLHRLAAPARLELQLSEVLAGKPMTFAGLPANVVLALTAH